MIDLRFFVEGADRDRMAPGVRFRLRLAETGGVPVHSVRLSCQVRIEAARRKYDDREKAQLLDLFGTPERWGQTLRDLTWAQVTAVVPAFTGDAVVDLAVPHDAEPMAAATRYCSALEKGEIPLIFLFSGTVLYEAAGVGPQVAPIPWDREARFRLPVPAWSRAFEKAALS